MQGKRLRSAVIRIGLACSALAPRAARGDDSSAKLELDASRREAEELITTAHQKPAASEEIYARAAELYVAAHRRFCGASGPPGRYVPDPSTCDELAYNGAEAYRAAKERTKSTALLR